MTFGLHLHTYKVSDILAKLIVLTESGARYQSMKFWERNQNREQPVDEPKTRVSLRDSVMDEGMKRLFQALTEATRSDAIVLPKVRLSNFLQVKSTECLEEAIKMDRKCVDFMICQPESLKPLAVVQLAREQASENSIDKFTTRALAQVGILVLQIRERNEYPVAGLRRQLIPKLLEAAEVSADENSNRSNTREPENPMTFPPASKPSPR